MVDREAIRQKLRDSLAGLTAEEVVEAHVVAIEVVSDLFTLRILELERQVEVLRSELDALHAHSN